MDTPQDNVRLSQSHVIARWGGLVNPDAKEGDDDFGVIQGDQDIHVDYGNNTLRTATHTTAVFSDSLFTTTIQY
jgi:hypothetical protein